MLTLLSLALSLSLALTAVPVGAATQTHSQNQARALPKLTPAPDDALSRALDTGAVSDAEYALERALSLFAPRPVTRRFGEVAPPAPRAATALLRDLALRRDQLGPDGRATADALLTRPTDNKTNDPVDVKYGDGKVGRSCTPDLCVHYVTSGPHAVGPSDSNGNGRPDYVDTVVEELRDRVWKREIGQLGFREPKRDVQSSNNGGNGKSDFYLADLGAENPPLYGYCASDDPHLRASSGYRFSDVSAYCVFDNDYRSGQFPDQTPIKNLRVTAAHEFFHAVQFGYDIFEDLWILENTAVWMEDEVYGGINDNLQFLATSSMKHPQVPLDLGTSFFEYGNFIFWKFATERFGTRLVKQVWNRADGAPGGPDLYSLRALRAAVEKRAPFGKTFVNFGIANFTPERHYEKGALYKNRVGGAPVRRRFTLGRSKRATALQRRRLDHLASAHFVISHGSGVKRGAKLQVKVDGPGSKAKPNATLVAFDGSRVVAKRFVKLNRQGGGTAKVPFYRTTRVLLLLSNASTRYRSCFSIPTSPFSCAGQPVDQNKTFEFKAKLIQ
ncbi:hypothetical protein BH20ACT23_BH20ACT23_21140 [soil metagenome]